MGFTRNSNLIEKGFSLAELNQVKLQTQLQCASKLHLICIKEVLIGHSIWFFLGANVAPLEGGVFSLNFDDKITPNLIKICLKYHQKKFIIGTTTEN